MTSESTAQSPARQDGARPREAVFEQVVDGFEPYASSRWIPPPTPV